MLTSASRRRDWNLRYTKLGFAGIPRVYSAVNVLKGHFNREEMKKKKKKEDKFEDLPEVCILIVMDFMGFPLKLEQYRVQLIMTNIMNQLMCPTGGEDRGPDPWNWKLYPVEWNTFRAKAGGPYYKCNPVVINSEMCQITEFEGVYERPNSFPFGNRLLVAKPWDTLMKEVDNYWDYYPESRHFLIYKVKDNISTPKMMVELSSRYLRFYGAALLTGYVYAMQCFALSHGYTHLRSGFPQRRLTQRSDKMELYRREFSVSWDCDRNFLCRYFPHELDEMSPVETHFGGTAMDGLIAQNIHRECSKRTALSLGANHCHTLIRLEVQWLHQGYRTFMFEIPSIETIIGIQGHTALCKTFAGEYIKMPIRAFFVADLFVIVGNKMIVKDAYNKRLPKLIADVYPNQRLPSSGLILNLDHFIPMFKAPF